MIQGLTTGCCEGRSHRAKVVSHYISSFRCYSLLMINVGINFDCNVLVLHTIKAAI